MKAYLINLKKDKKKLMLSRFRLSKASIEAIRVQATYGKEVNDTEIRRNSTERIYNQIHDPKVRYMNLGAWGCSHSHARTCKLITENDVDMSIVFEDDFFWLESPKKVRRVLANLLTKQVDFIALGYSPRGVFDIKAADESGECIQIDSKYRLIPFKFIGGAVGGSYGYVTSKAMAFRMWSNTTIVDRDADGFGELYEKEPVASKGMYILFPPIVHSSLDGSDIWEESKSVKGVVKKYLLKIINNNNYLLSLFASFQQHRLTKNYLSNTKVYKRNY